MIEFSPRVSSPTDRVRVEEAVSMKPVTACTPLEEEMPFTVQDILGRGLPSTVQVRVTVSSPVTLVRVGEDGVTWMFLKTACDDKLYMIYSIKSF